VAQAELGRHAIFIQQEDAHDLQGADALLPDMQADTLLADKAFDADQRVIEPLQAAGKTCVIPRKCNRKYPRPYDKDMYKARHLIENFYCWLKQLGKGSSHKAGFSPLHINISATCAVKISLLSLFRLSSVYCQHRLAPMTACHILETQ
jgi:hypothetical protein